MQSKSFPGLNSARISLPSSVRTGIFCRFGSELDNLPVAVTV